MVRTVGASSRTRGLQHGRARPARYVSARPRRDRNHRCRSPCNNRPQFGHSRSSGAEECACAPWRSPRLVMKDVSLVVSQGGHGTVTRSLVNALPQLILPMARDQAANAARVEAKGAGLRLPPMASEVEMAAAMNRLLTEPQFKESGRCVGDAIKADIDRSSLVH